MILENYNVVVQISGMTYSIVGILAIFIHLVVNVDVFLSIKRKNYFEGEKQYLFFLLAVISYHITDGFWGLLYDAHLVSAVFIDTTVYFITMALSILLWCLFIYHYLGKKYKTLLYVGLVVFGLQIIAIIVNFFYPILFNVTSDCVYSAGPMRYATLSVQIVMYLIIAIYTFVSSYKSSGPSKGRYFLTALFSIFMTISITLQVFFPLMPMYSLGYLLGICVFHTFVIEQERESQRFELEEAKQKVSIDPLTGVFSKHAYVDYESSIDQKIYKGEMEDFAIVVLDLNDLKHINDKFGHKEGDKYIVKSVELIREIFKDLPIYRVGGDEFTIFLLGETYNNRNNYLKEFNKRIEENVESGDDVIISIGLSMYNRKKDTTVLQTFTRADHEMYKRKAYIKSLQVKKQHN